jgi:predicted PhzF superfamily epimerase YddE/YHI9
LGVTPTFVGKSRFDYLLALETEDAVRRLSPDDTVLASLGVRGVIVTAQAVTPGFDFVSRFFAPGAGIPEDPATGSSHCALAPYWRDRLGKDIMRGLQTSARTGVISVQVVGPRVRLRGQAVTVLRGELVC